MFRKVQGNHPGLQKESMSKQRAILGQTIKIWRGDLDQLDEILVIRRRF